MITLFLTVIVPAEVATILTTWAVWTTAPRRAYKRHRAWLAHGTEYPRPDYRPVLRQMRAERERHGVPASFETAQAVA